jgi:hypothetical protein
MITVEKPGDMVSLACEVGGYRRLAASAGDDGERKRRSLGSHYEHAANLWQDYKDTLLGASGRED